MDQSSQEKTNDDNIFNYRIAWAEFKDYETSINPWDYSEKYVKLPILPKSCIANLSK